MKHIQFLLLFTLVSIAQPLAGSGIPALPLDLVEAEHVDFDEKIIHLVGHVKVAHEVGLLQCDEATLLLPHEKQATEQTAVQEILLKGNVLVQFTDGSSLTADDGEIDCQALKGTFFCHPPNKVVYTGFSGDGDEKIPVRATGRALHANITKTPQGYTLTSLRGEGAVNIEYLHPVESAVAETSATEQTDEAISENSPIEESSLPNEENNL